MNDVVLVEDGWTLQAPNDSDIDELMAWFTDARSVDRWGGPRFRYPFMRKSFRTDCRLDEIASYSLRNPTGVMAAFGQRYDRDDRAHLARLVTHPDMRRQGIGERLIRMIMRSAELYSGHQQSSLFVYRDNEPAYRCYLKMGFVVQAYPADAPLKGRCYFLTCKHNFAAAAD
jgi:ribosomal protein S18 acetylase RimI-like enzyme